METVKEYRKAKKPRHIVNGNAFLTPQDAVKYIRKNGFKLKSVERILSITIYHVTCSGLN